MTRAFGQRTFFAALLRSGLMTIVVAATSAGAAAATGFELPRAGLSPAERTRLVEVLTDAVTRRDWVGVHAGEALVELDLPEPALKAFSPQADTSKPAYRIGVWRVLARAETDEQRRTRHVQRIRDVLLDDDAPDRVHAVETLAKLEAPIINDVERRVVNALAKDPAAGPFALWRLIQAGDASALERLTASAQGSDPVGRARATYVLAQLPSASGGSASTKPATAERDRLERQLADGDEDARVAAALAMLRMDDEHRSATTRPRE